MTSAPAILTNSRSGAKGFARLADSTSRKPVHSVPCLHLEGTQAALPLPGTRRREREPAEQPSQGPLSLAISGGT